MKWIALILIAGVAAGCYMGNFFYMYSAVVCSAALYLLLKIKTMLEDLHAKSLGLPLTKNQIDTILRHSKSCVHESEAIVIFPHNGAKSPLVTLDGNPYVYLSLFKYYYSAHGSEYILQFPDMKPIVLELEDEYSGGVALFSQDGQLFVRADQLGLRMRIMTDKIVWGNGENGPEECP